MLGNFSNSLSIINVRLHLGAIRLPIWENYLFRTLHRSGQTDRDLQGPAKRHRPGLVNFVSAVAYRDGLKYASQVL